MAAERHAAHHDDRPRLGAVLTDQRPDRPALHIDADVEFSVDVGSGPVRGRIEAAGSTVRVVTDDAVTVWDAATGVPELGAELVPALAGLLAESGLAMEVTGPQGRIASLGDVPPSLVGRLATGSARVNLGRVRAVRPVALARLRGSRQRVLIGLAAAVVLGAVAALVATRRRADG